MPVAPRPRLHRGEVLGEAVPVAEAGERVLARVAVEASVERRDPRGAHEHALERLAGERLEDEVVRARLHRVERVVLVGAGREDDDVGYGTASWLRMRRVSSVPSIPGISQSVITTSGAVSANRRHASAPSSATVHSWPSRSTAAATIRRVPGSSSAMRMCMRVGGGGQGRTAPVIGRAPATLGRLDVCPSRATRRRPPSRPS